MQNPIRKHAAMVDSDYDRSAWMRDYRSLVLAGIQTDRCRLGSFFGIIARVAFLLMITMCSVLTLNIRG